MPITNARDACRIFATASRPWPTCALNDLPISGKPEIGGSYFSGVNPDAFTAGAQKAESVFWIFAISAAEVPVGCRPKPISFSCTSGDLTASTMTLLSRATTSGGVLAGAKIAYQPAASRS